MGFLDTSLWSCDENRLETNEQMVYALKNLKVLGSCISPFMLMVVNFITGLEF
jgi:hypothetical protein